VAEDEVTQIGSGAGSIRATDKTKSSGRRREHRKTNEFCLYILGLLGYCTIELFYIHFACIFVCLFLHFWGSL
jgi:hypothetical protein